MIFQKRYILASLILSFIIFFGQSYAISGSELFYSGDVIYDIQDHYSAGDTIKTNFIVSNMENFPLADAYLIIEIAQGCRKPVYPSQDSDCDNIFFENIIRDINIDSLKQISVPFSYTLPDDLKSGTYRMDVYLRTKKTPIVGIAHIFLPGRYKSFTLSGTGSVPSIKILRTTTEILDTLGPVGPPAEPDSLVKGTVHIKNEGSQKDGLSLFVGLCSWDDTGCDRYLWQNIYPFSIDQSETKAIDISFTAPEKPDAYAIKLIVKDRHKDIESIYRSRLIVTGKSPKIRKLWVNKRYYTSGEKVELNTLIFTSPDHYTNPAAKNTKLMVSLKDLDLDRIIFQESEIIPELSDNVLSVTKKYDFITDHIIKRFEICTQLNSEDDELYDRYCYEIDSSKFTSDDRIYTLNEKKFDTPAMEFSADLCAKDASDMPISSEASISITDTRNRESVMSGDIKIEGCHPIRFQYKPSVTYRILVNDKDIKKQYRFEIISDDSKNPIDVIDPGVHKQPDNTVTVNKDNNILLIFVFIMMILLVTAAVYFYTKTKNS